MLQYPEEEDEEDAIDQGYGYKGWSRVAHQRISTRRALRAIRVF